ncbi:2,3-bisphosphoglycerate-independent phosphoglycerate mutase [Desulfurispira natronophila]|uniref:2,3-bisphosphoglycerate-independent phosphoglycerate mutase n=1 Tax=Desulfurispira natronophila TaxID=682562 RepID=A0A7W7Y2U8_9BACT|nr:2,3-bisphosphoglycerate-independent phosphoglycerate mutase [Desulfurispira natronophila]MBB5021080.1 2,3-bisphosphoglycerate-independent phosphoglycerate mutase [Desulfurispira natronophila]
MPAPCALVILDGLGHRSDVRGNAVAAARMPFFKGLLANSPHGLLQASGEAVGLPPGQMGNSEVGHLNLGAGRVVYQELVRISLALREGTIAQNAPVNAFLAQVQQQSGILHFVGLLSDGGVHSHMEHLFGLIDYARSQGVKQIAVHAILDGRDTSPSSGVSYLKQFQRFAADRPGVELASVVGRFYAMDRDKRWERLEQAYQLFTAGEGQVTSAPLQQVEEAYGRGITDEFMVPIKVTDTPIMNAGDSVFCFNFRADRARQLTQALALDHELPFDAPVKLPRYLCLTEYAEEYSLPCAFTSEPLPDLLGEVVSRRGLRQLRIAETEKYAHVTFFFNGGEERQFEGEDRELIPSPRDVRTYDLKPQMSADDVAARLVGCLETVPYDLVVLNFANPDMVGHSGVFEAAVQACEAVDRSLQKAVEALRQRGYHVLITADHGNAEQMEDEHGNPHTAHTTNPVPVVLLSDEPWQLAPAGKLADVAPTLLQLLDVPVPDAMNGVSLVSRA